jgi:hypothetical protein
MVDSAIWDQDIAVPESVITFVDDSVSKREKLFFLSYSSTSLTIFFVMPL